MGLFSNKPSRFDLNLEGHVPAPTDTDTPEWQAEQQRISLDQAREMYMAQMNRARRPDSAPVVGAAVPATRP